MRGKDFNRFLEAYAGVIEQGRRPGALVDAVQFRMPLERMSDEWRYENIVPRYNAASLRGFAILMPEGMPRIGASPFLDGPTAYRTAYVGRRAAA